MIAGAGGAADSGAPDPVYRPSDDGILLPPFEVTHRADRYDPDGFEVLARMQKRHFWYRGRHRYVLRAMHDYSGRLNATGRPLRLIDLGGGCGGWVELLRQQPGLRTAEIALADSSLDALRLARVRVGAGVAYYQADLMNLGWDARWDVAFLLDVIEHLPDDAAGLAEAGRALVPGGLLFVTVPALSVFWSYNDELAGHLRRYARRDLQRLAERTGLTLLRAQYFVFFASPLLYLSRLFPPKLDRGNHRAVRALVERTHRVPPPAVNGALDAVLAIEERLARHMTFAWGTSLLAVLQKPVTEAHPSPASSPAR